MKILLTCKEQSSTVLHVKPCSNRIYLKHAVPAEESQVAQEAAGMFSSSLEMDLSRKEEKSYESSVTLDVKPKEEEKKRYTSGYYRSTAQIEPTRDMGPVDVVIAQAEPSRRTQETRETRERSELTVRRSSKGSTTQQTTQEDDDLKRIIEESRGRRQRMREEYFSKS